MLGRGQLERRLKTAPWLIHPDTQAIFSLLDGEGLRTRAVGGVVRDTLLGIERAGGELDFATELLPEEVMARAARRMVQRSLDAYATRDVALARDIWHEDPAIDRLQQQLYRDLLGAMAENPSTLTRATHHLWTVQRLERVADRATNICEQVIFMVDGEWPHFDTLHDTALLSPGIVSDGVVSEVEDEPHYPA